VGLKKHGSFTRGHGSVVELEVTHEGILPQGACALFHNGLLFGLYTGAVFFGPLGNPDIAGGVNTLRTFFPHLGHSFSASEDIGCSCSNIPQSSHL